MGLNTNLQEKLPLSTENLKITKILRKYIVNYTYNETKVRTISERAGGDHTENY